MFHQYPRRAILGATLMITQSFVYNAIYFTYALVLIHFYHVPSDKIASVGASAAYLTVSETWPIEIRAEAALSPIPLPLP